MDTKGTAYDPFPYQGAIARWFGQKPVTHPQVVASFAAWLKRASPNVHKAVMQFDPSLLAVNPSTVGGTLNLKGLAQAPGTSSDAYQGAIDAGGAAAIDTGNSSGVANLFSTWAQQIFGIAQQKAQSQAELDQIKANLALAEQGKQIQQAQVTSNLVLGAAFFLGILAILKATKK